MMNDILSASRLNTLLRCPRAHYWNHEVGLIKDTDSVALHFGSAWHRAMEARWKGANYDEALAAALPEGVELDAYSCATIAGLLVGYYSYYGERETFGKLYPECEFSYKLEQSRSFRVAGKIDGLGILHDERTALIESKTTSDSIDPASDYWLRLRFNMQIFQYVCAARKSGWDISHTVYDVTRKPSIKSKQVDVLDSDGLKIVTNQAGVRVFLKNGKPRQSGSTAEGLTVTSRLETPDEYADRLIEDTKVRPEFYFSRREVPILDDEVIEFIAQRLTLSRVILHCRQSEKQLQRPEQAWPRAVSESNCHFCSYSPFCLQNLSVDRKSLPAGYYIKFNPELTDDKTTDQK